MEKRAIKLFTQRSLWSKCLGLAVNQVIVIVTTRNLI
uniref:Uncharacterized protein n=1 Tax=Salmonella phage vB_STmST19_KE13 TaxID=3161167 RepID=A0AAU8GDE7_9CAUD